MNFIAQRHLVYVLTSRSRFRVLKRKISLENRFLLVAHLYANFVTKVVTLFTHLFVSMSYYEKMEKVFSKKDIFFSCLFWLRFLFQNIRFTSASFQNLLCKCFFMILRNVLYPFIILLRISVTSMTFFDVSSPKSLTPSLTHNKNRERLEFDFP